MSRLAQLETRKRRFQMKKIMSCLALVALAVFTSGAFAQDQAPPQNPAPAQQPTVAQDPAPDQEPTLTSAEVKFDTTTDNKDQQTKLDVYVKTSDGHEVAKSEGNYRPLEQEFYPHRHVTGRGQPNERRNQGRQRFADSPPAKKRLMGVQLQSYSQVL